MKICKKCCVQIPKTYRSNMCTPCRKHVNYLNTEGKNRVKFVKVPKKEQLENKRKKSREYYYKNKDSIKVKQKIYRIKNKDKLTLKNREWYKHKGKEYYKLRYYNDINFKIKSILISRLYKAIRSNQKSGSAVKDLGCSIKELKAHLESQFQEGMSWDNWGRGSYCWHIDHIRPLASFDLTVEQQFKEACHYTNLQPLWAEDNLKKGDKL